MNINELEKMLPSKSVLDKYKSELTDELYADPIIKKFLTANNLDSSFILDNLVSLMDMRDANKACLNCPGYLECPNKPKGYQQTLCLGDEAKLEFIRCKKLDEIYSIMEGYLERDFPDDWLYNSITNLPQTAVNLTLRAKLINTIKECKKGLYIYGTTGTGKSYITTSVVNSLIDTYGLKASFINFKNLIDDLKSNFETKGYADKRLQDLCDVDVLVLDDLGGEKSSSWSVQDVLFKIVESRLRNRKITFFTSMYSLNELMRIYGGSDPKTKRVIDTISILADQEILEGINYYKF